MEHSSVANILNEKNPKHSTKAHIAHGYFIILSQLKYLLYKANRYLYTETEQSKSTDKSRLLNVCVFWSPVRIILILNNLHLIFCIKHILSCTVLRVTD